jgi:hypothetical protein
MIVNTTIKRTYWLVFRPGGHWYTPLLKRNFGHVLVLTNNGENWLQLDPVANRLEPSVFDLDANVNLPRLLARQPNYSIIKLVLNELDTKRSILRPFFLLTCVEIVKYIIGLRSFCFTPYGLYRRLLRAKRLQKKPHGIESIEFIL